MYAVKQEVEAMCTPEKTHFQKSLQHHQTLLIGWLKKMLIFLLVVFIPFLIGLIMEYMYQLWVKMVSKMWEI